MSARSSRPQSSRLRFPGAVVCKEADLKGDITIGAGTVVHPKACIYAEAGPIVIGENNIIEEQVVIHNPVLPAAEGETSEPKVMVIGSHNTFEVGTRCEASIVGDHNEFKSRSFVGRLARISNNCSVGSGCRVDGDEELPEYTSVFGENRRRKGERPADQGLQLEFLSKILPNYHHLWPR